MAGFSDGASYALGVGLAFGARFSEIMAFSPGFVAQAGQSAGMPHIFVSHGRDDSVLPIARTSRRLVPALQAAGYSVHYEEFDGGHTGARLHRGRRHQVAARQQARGTRLSQLGCYASSASVRSLGPSVSQAIVD